MSPKTRNTISNAARALFAIFLLQPLVHCQEEDQVLKLSDLVITATRSARETDTIPANVTVITEEDIQKTSAQTVPDILRYQAGIQVSSWFGTGRKTTIDIRGFGEAAAQNNLVLVDGRRANNPDQSGVDWTLIPLDRIQRIEIVRGGGSVLYGDNATGGVVNIITKDGALENTIYSDTSIESYGGFRQSLGFHGSEGPWAYSTTGTYYSTDGYRENNDFRNRSAGLRLSYDTDWFRSDLSAGYKNDEYGLPGPLPLFHDPRDSFEENNRNETSDQYIHWIPTFRINENQELSLGMSYSETEVWSLFFNTVLEWRILDYGFSPRYKIDFATGSIKHQLSAGIDYYAANLHDVEFSLVTQGDVYRREVGYYLYDKMELAADRLFLDIGYRQSRVNYDYDQPEDNSYSFNSSTLGITYNYKDNSKIFVAFDRAFRTQALDELGMVPSLNPVADPQTSYHYQLGIQQAFGNSLLLAATIFQIDTDDEIFLDPSVGDWGSNANYEETQRRGLELELQAHPTERVMVFANYTWIDAKLEGGEFDGNKMPGVAPHSGSLGTVITATERLTFDLRGRWVKNKTAISNFENRTDSWGDSWFVVDTELNYNLSPFTFYVGVNNVFNEEYAEHGVFRKKSAAPKIYPSPERNFIAGVRINKTF